MQQEQNKADSLRAAISSLKRTVTRYNSHLIGPAVDVKVREMEDELLQLKEIGIEPTPFDNKSQ